MKPTEELQALRDGVGMVDRSDRGLVTVTGPDARSYLQSLVSQDLATLAVGQSAHALLLTPQGKLDVDARVVLVGEEALWLDTEPGFGEALAASLNRFRIRVKADVVDATATFGCISVRGPLAATLRDRVVAPALLDVAWAYGSGFDVLGPVDTLHAVRASLREAGVPECGRDAYEALRIEAGVPRQGADLDERTIPQEAFLERDAVSFTKGCFLGQELVCRIDSRGHVNRFLRTVRALDGSRPPVGADVLVGGKVVGSLTSVTPTDALPWFGLAFVRREVDPPAEVTVRWDGHDARARVEEAAATTVS